MGGGLFSKLRHLWPRGEGAKNIFKAKMFLKELASFLKGVPLIHSEEFMNA